jgi:hypothetical protein
LDFLSDRIHDLSGSALFAAAARLAGDDLSQIPLNWSITIALRIWTGRSRHAGCPAGPQDSHALRDEAETTLLGDDFTIKDDAGTDSFFVDSKAFSLGKQLSFQDMQGQELAFIPQKLLAWGPT